MAGTLRIIAMMVVMTLRLRMVAYLSMIVNTSTPALRQAAMIMRANSIPYLLTEDIILSQTAEINNN
jgi:hypothetical protein